MADWLSIEQEGAATRNVDATSTRATLMYETDFGFNPYVSYSTSFTPQPGQVVGSNIYATLLGQTLAPAAPLQGEQAEIGFKYQHPSLPFMVSGSMYELKQRNTIVQPDILFDAVEGATIKVRGFEIEAMGRVLPELKLIASYSYTDTTYDSYPELYPFPTGIGAFMQGKPVDGIPRHMASIWGVYTVQEGPLKGWSAGGGIRYVGAAQSYGRDIATLLPIHVETPAVTL